MVLLGGWVVGQLGGGGVVGGGSWNHQQTSYFFSLDALCPVTVPSPPLASLAASRGAISSVQTGLLCFLIKI